MKIQPLLALLVWLLIASLAQVHYGTAPTHGALHLTWSVVGAQLQKEEKAELENVPEHMRPNAQGSGQLVSVPYRLQMQVDQQNPASMAVQASGLRHDRPLCVYREIHLSAGSHRLRVEFRPESEVGLAPEQAKKLALFEDQIHIKAGEIVFLLLRTQPDWRFETRSH